MEGVMLVERPGCSPPKGTGFDLQSQQSTSWHSHARCLTPTWSTNDKFMKPYFSSGPQRGGSLAEQLTVENLRLLKDAFENHKTSPGRTSRRKPRKPKQDEGRGIEETGRRGREAPRINLEEFRNVLSSVIGPDVSDGSVERFFCEVKRTRCMPLL